MTHANPLCRSPPSQLLSQLFQTAQVNPLAGCLPALVQIPIFISLYRALQNLVAENKLDEPFLWIPDLEGPVYSSPPGESLDWIKSIFSGAPTLGWHDTVAFASLPVILYVSQTLSQKVLQPPKDPNKVLSEQEQVTQGLVNNLPFIVAFFSLNVPAGLGLYWVVNNILTTIITVVVKNKFRDTQMPPEVEQMMAMIDNQGAAKAVPRERGGGRAEMRMALEDRPSTSGFASAGGMDGKDGSIIDAETVEVRAASAGGADDEDDDEDDDQDGEKDKPKRKKRTKVSLYTYTHASICSALTLTLYTARRQEAGQEVRPASAVECGKILMKALLLSLLMLFLASLAYIHISLRTRATYPVRARRRRCRSWFRGTGRSRPP